VINYLKRVGITLAILIMVQLFFRSSPALAEYSQTPADLLHGQVMAVAYSGFREGQHPDRGDGAVNPSDEQILEDLNILVSHNFKLIRLYDAGENSATTLRLIRQHKLPIKVLQGIWLNAEISNHEGCSWLETPIPDAELAANKLINKAEIKRGIALDYVRQVKKGIKQPVTVADNYVWWINDGAPLAAEVDFIGVHTYPAWEEKRIDQGLAYTIQNIEDVHKALPGKPIAVLEGGWATIASEFGGRANEANQARYYREVAQWAEKTNTTFMFFEAFDEPWKGNPDNPAGAEKHWGIFNVDRTPKQVMTKINSK